MKFLALGVAMLCLWGRSLAAQDLSDPAAVLARCRATYAECATCRVEGEHSATFRTLFERTTKKGVRILFSRPDQLFRLDWTENEASFFFGGSTTQSIFTRSGHVYFYWEKLHRYERPRDLESALGMAAGISSGLTSFLPDLLRGESRPIDLREASFRAEETLDGVTCYVVSGTLSRSDTMELAIAKGDFAIHRVKEHYTVSPAKTQRSIEEMKKTHPALADKMADHPVGPDFDVDDATVYPHTVFGAPVAAADCDYPMPADTPLKTD